MRTNHYEPPQPPTPKSKLPIVEKALYEKIISVIKNEADSMQSPLSQIIDFNKMAEMSPVEQQRYILKMAELYRTLKHEYYETAKHSS